MSAARACQVGIGMFALADGDAARQRALVVDDAVVGDLEVVRPGVTRMPPPPWELFCMVKPSMLDGLQ